MSSDQLPKMRPVVNKTLPLGKSATIELHENIKVCKALIKAWEQRADDAHALTAIAEQAAIIEAAQLRIATIEHDHARAPEELANAQRQLVELERQLTVEVNEPKIERFKTLAEQAQKMVEEMQRSGAIDDPDVLEAMRILGVQPKSE
jgi:hypothetical protein